MKDKEIIQALNVYLGYRISYYYDLKGITVRKINDDDVILTEMENPDRSIPTSSFRTLASLLEHKSN